MSLLTPPSIKFLLDENVRVELSLWLRSRGVSFVSAPKSASDGVLAEISKRRDLIVVTNDKDFIEADKDDIFSVILLRLPQNDPELLCSCFNKLLDECGEFEGRLIILEPSGWDSYRLSETVPS